LRGREGEQEGDDADFRERPPTGPDPASHLGPDAHGRALHAAHLHALEEALLEAHHHPHPLPDPRPHHRRHHTRIITITAISISIIVSIIVNIITHSTTPPLEELPVGRDQCCQ
jgi:hypothetical protein